jgi:hypothetical protein
LPRHDNQAVGSGSQIEKPMVVVQHPARPRGSRRLRTVVLVEVCSPAHRRPQHGGHIRPLEDPRAVARVPGRSCRHRAAPWTLARTGRSKWSSRTILKSYRLGISNSPCSAAIRRLPASQQPERHQQVPAGNLQDQALCAGQAGRCDLAGRGSFDKQIQSNSF